MKSCIEQLTQLMRECFCFLSDEHLAWDQWSLDWQEHSRKKPNQEYTSAIWAMTKGYLDACQNSVTEGKEIAVKETATFAPRHQRAVFREQIANLGLRCNQDKTSAEDKEAIIHLNDDRELIADIQSLSREILSYFLISKD